MKQRILVDMDGVLADVYAQFLKWEYQHPDRYPQLETLYGKTEREAFSGHDRDLNSVGFFRTIPLMPGSVAGLEYLNAKHDVRIVSAAMQFPLSLGEKYDWLREYFPFIHWKQIMFCGLKDAVHGDVMIDDHPKNLKLFNGRKLLFTQPHNYYLNNPEFERVNDWQQMMQLL